MEARKTVDRLRRVAVAHSSRSLALDVLVLEGLRAPQDRATACAVALRTTARLLARLADHCAEDAPTSSERTRELASFELEEVARLALSLARDLRSPSP